MAVTVGARPDAPSVRRRAGLLGLLTVAWAVTRLPVVELLLGRHSWVRGDLGYFQASLEMAWQHGLAGTLVEYPLPGVVVIAVPWLLTGAVGWEDGYGTAVLVLSLAADAAWTLLLALRAGRHRTAAVVVWLAAVPALGATAYARFDLVPGLLVGVAVLLLGTHPTAAAAAGALATGVKLAPGLVLPALAAPAGTRRRVVTTVAVVGGVLAAASWLAAGWSRLASPLTWQAERGLHVESVVATPLVLAWSEHPDRYAVDLGPYNAFEVAGPGAGELLATSGLASVLLLGLLGWLWARAWRRPGGVDVETVAWLALAGLAGFVVTSKVLSPQYLLWLLPAAAAAVAVSRGRGVVVWAGLLVVGTVLTQLVFPVLYGHLVSVTDTTGVAVGVLATRNLLLLALAGWALVVSWRRTARRPLP